MSTPSPSPGLWPIADLRIWKVLVSAIRAAPRWGQITIAGVSLGVAAITAIAIAGLVGTHRPGVQQQLLSLIIAHTGLLLLGIAIFLYRLTQRPGRWRAILRRPDHIGTPRMHGLLLALPLVAFTAGCMLVAATAILLPSMLTPVGRPFILIGVVYLGVVGLAANTVREATRFLYRFAREQSEAATRAERDATDARLAALQAQMNPHFLFNALNTVAALIASHPDRAEATVEHLASVLRRTLDRSRSLETTVAEEVEYLHAYLSIERERFGSRLHVEWAIDPQAASHLIPPMTLQPLVENALKHAVGGTLNPCRITIAAASRNGALTLSVADDGPGFAFDYRDGTGLSNLRARLETMSGGDATLSVESRPGDTVVSVRIPTL